MNILALDLGTKCGWACNPWWNGVWYLKPSTHQSAGERFRKFKLELLTLRANQDIKYVVYEEVHKHLGVEAAHIYGGLVAVLQEWCLDSSIEYRGVGVGTIKKHATGKGNADKKAMIAAAIKLFPKINVLDDNHADALCLYDWAINNVLL